MIKQNQAKENDNGVLKKHKLDYEPVAEYHLTTRRRLLSRMDKFSVGLGRTRFKFLRLHRRNISRWRWLGSPVLSTSRKVARFGYLVLCKLVRPHHMKARKR